MTKRLPLEWVKDLGPQDKDQFEKTLRYWVNSDLGRKWRKMIEDKISKADQRSCDYKEGWQFQQAHLNGYRQMAQEMLDLIEFGETK